MKYEDWCDLYAFRDESLETSKGIFGFSEVGVHPMGWDEYSPFVFGNVFACLLWNFAYFEMIDYLWLVMLADWDPYEILD